MKAVYPGSFDPVHNGHIDIIERAAKIFDDVIVAVAVNRSKNALLTPEERVCLLKEACRHLANVNVDYFEGLLVDYAQQVGASVAIRGLRAISDFEYELQMALTNKRLNPNVETMFMMASGDHSFIGSSLIKELAELNAPLDGLVPGAVEELLETKIRQKRAGGGER
jgi:pantetheine-phosphate adenylyltransferase